MWGDAASVDGMLSRSQGEELAKRAAGVPPNTHIVEVGSHHGRSTSIIARSAPTETHVHAVDVFDDPRWGGGADALQHFEDNLTRLGVRDRVELHRAPSANVALAWTGEPISFAFIDGAHDIESVVADIDGWAPFVIVGGNMSFHDAYSAPGVTVAVFKRFFFSSQFAYKGSVRSLARFERVDATMPQRVWSSARMVLRLHYQARNIVIKIGVRRGWPWMYKAMGQSEPVMPH
jgi:predicted O-methyltransferase YrrM